tara:strand:+ start:1576 stop:1887 length:312 start_codon:yes stop_codon:yes gene_type:complete
MGRVKEMNEESLQNLKKIAEKEEMDNKIRTRHLLIIEEKEKKVIIKESVDEFLLEGGKDLGYDDLNLPRLKDMEAVLENKITCWEYYGYKTKEEYDKASGEIK